MRTLIDLPDPDLQALTDIAQRSGVSRAAVIREAVADYLARHSRPDTESAFGLWGRQTPDGVELQRQLRDEW